MAKKLPSNGGDRPQVVVTLDYDSLRAGILDNGAQLSAVAPRRMACDANLIPAVLNTDVQILDVGRERRLFTGHLRRVLVVRDRGCAFPSCDRPARWCKGHHVKHWLNGGTTALNNAVLLCGFHHRPIHHGDWQVRIKGGLPEFTPPSYVDSERKTLRDRYHRRP